MSLIDAIHLALLVLVVLCCVGILQRILHRRERQYEWRRQYRTPSTVPPRRFPTELPKP